MRKLVQSTSVRFRVCDSECEVRSGFKTRASIASAKVAYVSGLNSSDINLASWPVGWFHQSCVLGPSQMEHLLADMYRQMTDD